MSSILVQHNGETIQIPVNGNTVTLDSLHSCFPDATGLTCNATNKYPVLVPKDEDKYCIPQGVKMFFTRALKSKSYIINSIKNHYL